MRKRTLFNIALVIAMILSAGGIAATICEVINGDYARGDGGARTEIEVRTGSERAPGWNDPRNDGSSSRYYGESGSDAYGPGYYAPGQNGYGSGDGGQTNSGNGSQSNSGSNDSNSTGQVYSYNGSGRMYVAPGEVDESGGRIKMIHEDGQENSERKLVEHYALRFGLFSAIFLLSLTFLILSWKYPTFYEDKSKLLIYVLGNIILIAVATAGLTAVTINLVPHAQEGNTQVSVDLDETNVLNEGAIDLGSHDKDVTIKSGGTYTLSGALKHSVIIDADGQDVKIVLDNAEISSGQTAAIVGVAANKITISLADGSENTLSDGGESDYDGAIFSNAELVFEGNGALTVNGRQNEGEGIASEAQNITFNSGTYTINSNDDGINAGGDGGQITINGGNFYINTSGDGIDSNQNAVINGGTIFVIGSDQGGNSGIDTENGYTINGGTVVALGSDMLETPEASSKQNVLALTLNQTIAKDTTVALLSGENTVVAWSAPKSFRTIVISSPNLAQGTYTLSSGGTDSGQLVRGIYQNGSYTGGSPIAINGMSSFAVNQTVNSYGANGNGRNNTGVNGSGVNKNGGSTNGASEKPKNESSAGNGS